MTSTDDRKTKQHIQSSQDYGSLPSSSIEQHEDNVLALSRIASNMRQIKSAPRELWIIYTLKFFSSYSYFALSLVLTLYLSEAFQMSDLEAGWAFGMNGLMTTISGVACGWFIDLLGVRLSLIVGSVLGVISRMILAITTSKTLALAMLFSILPFSDSLGIPIMTIGVKRYTNETNRTFAYSLFYAVMNVAALLTGSIVDLCRNLLPNGFYVYNNTIYISSLRFIIITTCLSSLFLFIISVLYVREIELDKNGNVQSFRPSTSDNTRLMTSLRQISRDIAFWRLFLLTVLLIGVKLIFSHLSATMPKYLIRQFGEDAPYGLIFSINPFLIIFLVPSIALVTKHISPFNKILYGSFLAAASPLCICIQQSYLMIVIFNIVLSIGEAIYSPSTYEYSMQLSKHGQEGLYGSLAAAPLFSAPLISGGMSGWLLQTYMPVDGVKQGKIVWAVIGCISLTSPILMFIFRDFLGATKRDDDDGDEQDNDVENEET